MLAPVINRDPGDETDWQCDAHPDTEPQWYEDGDGESGPQEPYPDCPACRYEHEHPILTCDVCGKESRVVKRGIVAADFDPTVASTLECGHTIL